MSNIYNYLQENSYYEVVQTSLKLEDKSLLLLSWKKNVYIHVIAYDIKEEL